MHTHFSSHVYKVKKLNHLPKTIALGLAMETLPSPVSYFQVQQLRPIQPHFLFNKWTLSLNTCLRVVGSTTQKTRQFLAALHSRNGKQYRSALRGSHSRGRETALIMSVKAFGRITCRHAAFHIDHVELKTSGKSGKQQVQRKRWTQKMKLSCKNSPPSARRKRDIFTPREGAESSRICTKGPC